MDIREVLEGLDPFQTYLVNEIDKVDDGLEKDPTNEELVIRKQVLLEVREAYLNREQ